MPGPVKQFPDYSANTAADTGENNTASIQPIANGENVVATVLNRPSESLRQRTEVLRSVLEDTLYLRDADQRLLITGPGLITWPGSTTAGHSGIPVISDNLYIIPGHTPGSAQTPPVPPTQSTFGTLHLKRVTGSSNAILVTSQRRSYAAGDQISIDVTSGTSFSCTLDVENTYQRTIHIVATGSTTLSTVITALNALTPSAPDNASPLVTAVLEGGALGTDLLLVPQAKQFVSGNYDGEAHAITPANLAGFFVSNPSQALAEGDSLCIQYAMVSDTASTGGRRQAIPENSNTAVASGAFFNSRVHPELLVNAIHVCKVVNGRLVFSTGCEIAQGATNVHLSVTNATDLQYNGGPNWADGTTNPATTVDGQLTKIISDLAGATGANKIEGPTVGTYLTAGPLGNQISTIAGFVHDDRAPAESSAVPLRLFRDYQGNARSLVDHNGYRMGQVSEIDDNWRFTQGTGPQTLIVPVVPGIVAAGNTAHGAVLNGSTAAVRQTSGGDEWAVPLPLPPSAVITSCVVYFSTSANTDVVTMSIAGVGVTPSSSLPQAVATTLVYKTVSGGTGPQSTDILVSPTFGHGPVMLTVNDNLYLTFYTTVTASQTLFIGAVVTYTTDPVGWSWTGSTTNQAAVGDARNYLDPISGFNQRHVQLVGAGASSNASSVLTSSFDTWLDADSLYVQEWMVKTGTITDASNAALFNLGVDFATTSRKILVHWNHNITTWKLRVQVGFSLADVDSLVAVTANTVYRMRLEILGANRNSSGNMKIRLYINGSKVAEVTNNTLPTSDEIRAYFSVLTDAAPAGPYDFRVGRLRRVWNHLPTEDAL